MATMMEDMSLVSDIRDLDEHHGTSITNKNGYGVFYAYTVFYQLLQPASLKWDIKLQL
jgi:hypothetical protein